ncbi:hypothetical protein ACOMHN_043388 [Nucella lapillus]
MEKPGSDTTSAQCPQTFRYSRSPKETPLQSVFYPTPTTRCPEAEDHGCSVVNSYDVEDVLREIRSCLSFEAQPEVISKRKRLEETPLQVDPKAGEVGNSDTNRTEPESKDAQELGDNAAVKELEAAKELADAQRNNIEDAEKKLDAKLEREIKDTCGAETQTELCHPKEMPEDRNPGQAGHTLVASVEPGNAPKDLHDARQKEVSDKKKLSDAEEKADVEITKADVGITKADFEITKPDVEITKPDVEIKKPDVEITKADVEITKADVEITKPDIEITKADVEIKKPDVEVKKPDVEIKKPDVEIKKADVEIKKADVEIKKPDVEIKKADFEIKKPDVEIKKPDVEIKKADVEIKKPDVEIKKADVEIKKPDVEIKKADVEIKKADVEIKKPDVEIKKPDVEIKKADVEITKADVEITKADVEITKADVEITKVDFEITKADFEIKKADISKHEIDDAQKADIVNKESSDSKQEVGNATVADEKLPETTFSERAAGDQEGNDAAQMVLDAFEFYSEAAQGRGRETKTLTPIDKTMSIYDLMKARQDVLVEVPLAHVTYMAQNFLLLRYGRRLLKGLDVTEIADQLLQNAESRLSMAKEMELILFLCTTRHGVDGHQPQYRELQRKLLGLLEELDVSPITQSPGECRMLTKALSHGLWDAVKVTYTKVAKLKQPELNRVYLLAALYQDWDVFLDCAVRGTSITGTPDTDKYQRQLEQPCCEMKFTWSESFDTFADGKGTSPLHIAIRSGHFPIEKLDKRISIDKELANAVDLSGDSLLHAAAQGMDAKAVKVLCRCGADVNVKDSQGKTALQLVMTEATKLVAAHNIRPTPPTPNADAMTIEEQTCEKLNEDRMDVMEKMPQEKKTISEGDQTSDYSRQLSKLVDLMVTMVSAAGRSGQTVEWPPGDSGWTALHILCAAGGYQHLKTFVKIGADPRALREGHTLIDTVTWQRNLPMEQQMKTMQVLLTDLGLMNFQVSVARDKAMEGDEQLFSYSDRNWPIEGTRESGNISTPDSVKQENSHDLKRSKLHVAAASTFTKKRYCYQDDLFQRLEGGGTRVPDSEAVKKPAEVSEKAMSTDSDSLPDCPLLTSIVQYIMLGEVTMVENLAQALMSEVKHPAVSAGELLQVLKSMNKENDPRFQPLFTTLSRVRDPASTVEEAFNNEDCSTVMKHGRSGAALSRRELTIVMLAAAQKGDTKLFYNCLRRGGSLTGMDSKAEEAGRELVTEAHGDKVSSATTLDKCQTTETKTEDNREKQKLQSIPSPLEAAVWNREFRLSELAASTATSFDQVVRSAEKHGHSLLHYHGSGQDIPKKTLANLTFLLSRGANFNAKNQGLTVLQTLIEEKHSEAIVRLVRKAVDCGLSIDWTPAPDTWTALHVLAANGAYEDILFFVEHGADPRALRSRTGEHHVWPDSMEDDYRQRNRDTPVKTSQKGGTHKQTEKPADTDKDVKVVTDGLTLIDTAVLQHNLPDDRRFYTLRTLLEDLYLGPYHAQIVDKRPEGVYYQHVTKRSRNYRYPMEHLLQPSIVTSRTKRTTLELVQLMLKHGAVGTVEKAVIMDKTEQFKQLPFCQPVVSFLEASLRNTKGCR